MGRFFLGLLRQRRHALQRLARALDPLAEHMGYSLRCIGLLGLFTACALPAVGCKKDEPAAQSAEPAASDKPAGDSKIAKAMKAAAQQAQGQAMAGGDAVSPNGLLSMAAADAKIPRGNFSGIKLGSTGSEPRLHLGAQSTAAASSKGNLELAVRTGPRSALPTIALDLEIQSRADASGAALETKLKVASARLGNEQPGQIPQEVAAMVPKLKGSSFALQSKVGSGRTAIGFEAAPAVAQGEFEVVLAAASELLNTLWLPYPSEPVGEGAYWMTESRETFYRAEVLAYRLVKVEGIDGNKAKLSVATKRYLVGESMNGMGLPPHTVLHYQAPGDAELVVAAGATLPEQAQISDNLAVEISLQSDPKQSAPLQVGMRAQFVAAGAGVRNVGAP
ncbi:MAG TPA: hypothetical protein VL137_14240 [Polyangiaceae bacterium]|nr:hypothetical protein [Polyangiaceae bacterium]